MNYSTTEFKNSPANTRKSVPVVMIVLTIVSVIGCFVQLSNIL